MSAPPTRAFVAYDGAGVIVRTFACPAGEVEACIGPVEGLTWLEYELAQFVDGPRPSWLTHHVVDGVLVPLS